MAGTVPPVARFVVNDNAGRLVENGDFVCYNWQGSVAFGMVLSIKPLRRRSYYGRGGVNIKIMRLLPEPRERNQTSIVRSGNSLMKIPDRHFIEVDDEPVRGTS